MASNLTTPLDVGERIRMYLMAGSIALVYLLNWLLP